MKRIETPPARRRGKFRRLVEDFESTLAQHGAALPLATIEQFLADRITVTASAIGSSEQTVLGTYFPDSWGADMARQALEDRAIGHATEALADDAELPVALAGRLIAALGQAQRFAATNAEFAPGIDSGIDSGVDSGPGAGSDVADPHPGPASGGLDTGEWRRVAAAWENAMPGGPPGYDPAAAADATSALGLALYEAVAGDDPSAPRGTLTVPGEAILRTRRTLEAAEQQLRRGRWVSCRCPDCSPTSAPGTGAAPAPAPGPGPGPGPGPDSIEHRVAEQLAADRARLDRYAPARPPRRAEYDPTDMSVLFPGPADITGPGGGSRTPPPV